MMTHPDKWKHMAPMVGSLVVDTALVAAVAWWGSGQAAQAEQIANTLNAAISRIERLEEHKDDPSPATIGRISVLESRMTRAEADRTEIISSLRRIEDRLIEQDRREKNER